MTTPNKFESAARLQRALDKLEAKREANVNAALAEYAEKRAAILAAADPEARALVLAEPGFPVEVSCDGCENMHAPPACVDAVAEPTRPSLLHGHIPPDLKADAQAARKAGKGQLHDE